MPTTAVIGGIAAYSAYQSSKQGDAARKAAESASQQQSDLSKTLADYAGRQYSLTAPALGKAVDYYSKIASGTTADVQSAIAPDVNNLTQTYGGTRKYLEQQGVRGGARDAALAETGRQEAGQVGLLPFQARETAISNLGQIGAQGVTQAGQLASSAASAAGGAGQTAIGGGYLGIRQGEDIAGFGSSLASTLMPYILGQNGKGVTGPGVGGPGSFGFLPYGGGAMMGPGSPWGYGLQSNLPSTPTTSTYGGLAPS